MEWNVIKESSVGMLQSTRNGMEISFSIKYFINCQYIPTQSIRYIYSLKENTYEPTVERVISVL